MARDDKPDLLARIPLFAACSKKELSTLASLSTVLTFPAGAVLTRQGTFGREFLVLMEGTAVAERDGVVLEELVPGSPLGELSLIDGAVRAATVTTTSPVTALVLSVTEFRDVLAASPALANALLVATTRRLRAVMASAESALV
jgi:CRP-like cAMP-binding protein